MSTQILLALGPLTRYAPDPLTKVIFALTLADEYRQEIRRGGFVPTRKVAQGMYVMTKTAMGKVLDQLKLLKRDGSIPVAATSEHPLIKGK